VFRRLYLIAACSTVLREEAAKLLIKEARKGSDVQNFYDAVGLLQQLPTLKDVDRLADPSWAKDQDKKNASDTHKLENELKGYKNNLIKESIRVCMRMPTLQSVMIDVYRWVMRILVHITTK
jgi:COP9 signalosome complex subunit 1